MYYYPDNVEEVSWKLEKVNGKEELVQIWENILETSQKNNKEKKDGRK